MFNKIKFLRKFLFRKNEFPKSLLQNASEILQSCTNFNRPNTFLQLRNPRNVLCFSRRVEKYFTTLTKAFIFVDFEELRFENSLERLSRRNDWDCRKIELRWHLYKISVHLLYLNIHAFCVRKHAIADMHTHFSRPKISRRCVRAICRLWGLTMTYYYVIVNAIIPPNPERCWIIERHRQNPRINVINFR